MPQPATDQTIGIDVSGQFPVLCYKDSRWTLEHVPAEKGFSIRPDGEVHLMGREEFGHPIGIRRFENSHIRQYLFELQPMPPSNEFPYYLTVLPSSSGDPIPPSVPLLLTGFKDNDYKLSPISSGGSYYLSLPNLGNSQTGTWQLTSVVHPPIANAKVNLFPNRIEISRPSHPKFTAYTTHIRQLFATEFSRSLQNRTSEALLLEHIESRCVFVVDICEKVDRMEHRVSCVNLPSIAYRREDYPFESHIQLMPGELAYYYCPKTARPYYATKSQGSPTWYDRQTSISDLPYRLNLNWDFHPDFVDAQGRKLRSIKLPLNAPLVPTSAAEAIDHLTQTGLAEAPTVGPRRSITSPPADVGISPTNPPDPSPQVQRPEGKPSQRTTNTKVLEKLRKLRRYRLFENSESP
ncbi:MAG: hypothetical protein R3E01_33135 [Pirellulaceae bacterium]